MPALKNKKHEAFCKDVAGGMQASQAYRENISDCDGNDPSVWAQASRMMADVKVALRIKELRSTINVASDEAFVVGKIELLQFHSRNLRSPLSCLRDDADTIQEVTRSFVPGEGEDDPGKEIEKIKVVSKMDSAKEIAKIRGFYEPEKVDVTVSGTSKATVKKFLADKKAKRLAGIK